MNAQTTHPELLFDPCVSGSVVVRAIVLVAILIVVLLAEPGGNGCGTKA